MKGLKGEREIRERYKGINGEGVSEKEEERRKREMEKGRGRKETNRERREKREIGEKERKERKGEVMLVEEFMRLEGKINIKKGKLVTVLCGNAALQTSLDLCIPEKELAKTHSQIYIFPKSFMQCCGTGTGTVGTVTF